MLDEQTTGPDLRPERPPEHSVDALVAGGGMAGASAAAALSAMRWNVLLVEPGLDPAKRLAGELIHPPGVSDLAELGLLGAVEGAGSASVLGFAVFDDVRARPFLLPYGAIPGIERQGYAVDHALLRGRLLARLRALPHVTTWMHSRVIGLDLGANDHASVTVTTPHGTRRIRARLVVAADGAASTLRRLAGIRATRVQLSRMTGYVVRGTPPYPGYGNVFLGGPAPILAYAIGDDAVRVMFDIPDNPDGLDAPARNAAYLDALPAGFRERVRQAIASSARLVSVNATVIPDRVAHGRLVLVGDAAGSCHPLTATGLSVCTRDALRLRQALRDTGGDVPRALARFAHLRGGPQVTRMALAGALYDAFAARTPEMRLLRDGILRFWERSARGRAASMALLSTHEGRLSRMALEYAHVIAYALTTLVRHHGRVRAPHGVLPSGASRHRTLWGVGRATVRHAGRAIKIWRLARA